MGGMKARETGLEGGEQVDDAGNVRNQKNLFMNGPEIFSFTLLKAVQGLLEKSKKTVEDIDLFILHQATLTEDRIKAGSRLILVGFGVDIRGGQR